MDASNTQNVDSLSDAQRMKKAIAKLTSAMFPADDDEPASIVIDSEHFTGRLEIVEGTPDTVSRCGNDNKVVRFTMDQGHPTFGEHILWLIGEEA